MVSNTTLMPEDYDELIRPKEVAKTFNITVKTLWEWQKKGLIKSVRLPTGKLRYPRSEVDRVWRQAARKQPP